MTKGELQGYYFAIGDQPHCVWGWGLYGKNIHFLREIDHEYFQYVAQVHTEHTEGKDKGKAAIALRSAYYHGLETLFSLIFSMLQAPQCSLPWILKAKPWQIRKLAGEVCDGKLSGPVRFRLDAPTWENISALVHGVVFREMPNKEQLQQSFATLWRRFAKEYTNQFLVDEYNSVKHGFRMHLGGMKISFAPSDDPTKKPNPDEYIPLGESELGSFFYVPEQIEDSPVKKRDADPHFWLREQHANNHPAQTDAALLLIAVSINNIRSFLRIFNHDDKGAEIRLLHPLSEEMFEAPWKNRSTLLNFTATRTVVEQRIKRMSSKEIMELLAAEKDNLPGLIDLSTKLPGELRPTDPL